MKIQDVIEWKETFEYNEANQLIREGYITWYIRSVRFKTAEFEESRTKYIMGRFKEKKKRKQDGQNMY